MLHLLKIISFKIKMIIYMVNSTNIIINYIKISLYKNSKILEKTRKSIISDG